MLSEERIALEELRKTVREETERHGLPDHFLLIHALHVLSRWLQYHVFVIMSTFFMFWVRMGVAVSGWGRRCIPRGAFRARAAGGRQDRQQGCRWPSGSSAGLQGCRWPSDRQQKSCFSKFFQKNSSPAAIEKSMVSAHALNVSKKISKKKIKKVLTYHENMIY